MLVMGEMYGCDSEDLAHEIHQVERILKRKAESGELQLTTVMALTVFLERSFSDLKLIKTHLRTTMVDSRLSHLGMLRHKHG